MEKYENVFRVLGIGMIVPVILLNLFGDAMGIPTGVRNIIVLVLLSIQIAAVIASVILVRRKLAQMKKKNEEFMKKFDETIENQTKYN